jgi:hypothetical protein
LLAWTMSALCSRPSPSAHLKFVMPDELAGILF